MRSSQNENARLLRAFLIITVVSILFYTAIFGQPADFGQRQKEIKLHMMRVYSVVDFWQLIDNLQLTLEELCDYPVIFPLRKPKRISSGFGFRKHPISGANIFHTGIDFSEPMGTAVYATGNGKVVRRDYDLGYGYFVEIEHESGFRSFYAHLSHIWVDVGDKVNIAQQIASVGDSGAATGCHLHYEIRKGNRFLNPIGWCRSLEKNN